MKFRYRCACGNVFDSESQVALCPTCQRQNSTENCGIVQIYRMGNYSGMAVGMGLYVDNQPYGHVANKGSIKLVVPYGQHQLHATLSTIRKSNNPVITLTPQAPEVYFKMSMPFFGGIVNFNPADKGSMPEK